MSREVRRVPLDFDWPLKEIWSGYLRPDTFDFPSCPDCTYEQIPTVMDRMLPTPRRGSGYTPEAYAVSQTFYPHMIGGPMAERLAWHNKLGQREVDYLVEKGRLSVWRSGHWSEEPRTAAEVNLQRHPHDAINRSYLIEFRCEQLGITLHCLTCKGNGDVATDEEREAAENWEGTEPPSGEGWQLWETTSEGSPTSPVFATGEELAQWMSRNPCGFAGSTIALEVARKWVLETNGWSPSMVAGPDGLKDGITFAAGAS